MDALALKADFKGLDVKFVCQQVAHMLTNNNFDGLRAYFTENVTSLIKHIQKNDIARPAVEAAAAEGGNVIAAHISKKFQEMANKQDVVTETSHRKNNIDPEKIKNVMKQKAKPNDEYFDDYSEEDFYDDEDWYSSVEVPATANVASARFEEKRSSDQIKWKLTSLFVNEAYASEGIPNLENEKGWFDKTWEQFTQQVGDQSQNIGSGIMAFHKEIEEVISEHPKIFGSIKIVGKETFNILSDIGAVQACIVKGWSRILLGDANSDRLESYGQEKIEEFYSYASKKLDNLTPEQKLTALYGLASAAAFTKTSGLLAKYFDAADVHKLDNEVFENIHVKPVGKQFDTPEHLKNKIKEKTASDFDPSKVKLWS